MRLFTNNTPDDWRKTFSDSVQVDFAEIPNGNVVEVEDEDGVPSKKMETDTRAALGFQTETGRGKGVQWVPVEDIPDALSALQHYADNGVEAVSVSDEWLSPAESIHETITRIARRDSEGNKIEGKYDISFRVRMGKGSKSCRVPEEDFAEFVQLLSETIEYVPKAVDQLMASVSQS